MRRLAVAISALPVVLAACANRPELDDFERTLAAQDSATVALSQWCATQGLAQRPTITAMAVAGPALPPPADIAGLLTMVLPVALLMLWLSWPWFVASWTSQEVSASAGGLRLVLVSP